MKAKPVAWLIAALVVVVAGISVGVTLVLTDDGSPRIVQPPGCSPEDADRPGCRPVAQERGSGNTVAIVTVIVTPLAAVVLALLTGLLARERLGEQLDAERGRFEAQLQAEQARFDSQLDNERQKLAQQLAHERRLADVAELRTIIDDAAAAMHKTIDQISEAHARLETGEPVTAPRAKAAEGNLKNVYDCLYECFPLIARLRSRLGGDATIVERLADFSNICGRAASTMNASIGVGQKWTEPQELNALMLAQREALRGFEECARELIGAQLDSVDPGSDPAPG